MDDLSLPKELDQLKQLEVINLGGNRLKQFPYQLFQMFNLKEVYLGSNQISFLPDLFQTLTKYEISYQIFSFLSFVYLESKFSIWVEIKLVMFRIPLVI